MTVVMQRVKSPQGMALWDDLQTQRDIFRAYISSGAFMLASNDEYAAARAKLQVAEQSWTDFLYSQDLSSPDAILG